MFAYLFSAENKRKKVVSYLIVFAAVLYLLLYWYRILILGLFRLNPDTLIYIYPFWSIGQGLLKDGWYFLWDPFRNMGQPFLAMPQNQALYPVRFFSLFLDWIDYQRVNVVFHTMLASGFAWALGKRMGGRGWDNLLPLLAFGFNGFFLARLGYDPQFAAIAWAPCVLYFMFSERPGFLGLALGLQWLAGYPTFVILTFVGALTLIVVSHRRRSLFSTLMKGAFVGAGVSAVQWVPFLEALILSERTLFYGGGQSIENAILPVQFLKQIFLPIPWLGVSLKEIHSFSLFYLGPVFLFFFVLGLWRGDRRTRVAGLFAVLFALLSFGGRFLPYEHIPGITIFRYPSNWLFLFLLMGVLVSLRGLASLSKPRLKVVLLLFLALDLQYYAYRSYFYWGDMTYWKNPQLILEGRFDPERGRLFHSPPLVNKITRNAGQSVAGWTMAMKLLLPSLGPTFGFRDTYSQDSMRNKRISPYINRMMKEGLGSPLFNYAGIGTVVAPTEAGSRKEILSWDDFGFWPNPQAKPRAFFVDTGTDVEIKKDVPGEFVADVEGPGQLVFSEAFYPGWRVTIDGVRRDTGLFENFFLSVPVPAGNHRVRFSYLPLSFLIGLFVSLMTLLFLMFFWIKIRGKRRESEGQIASSLTEGDG